MIILCDSHEQALALAKKALFLAWKACDEPVGIGILKIRSQATEDEVWNNAISNADYPKLPNQTTSETKVYADYVFGKMMKIGFRIEDNAIIVSDFLPDHQYQDWSRKYPKYEDLFNAAKQ